MNESQDSEGQHSTDDRFARYARQIQYKGFGAAGQERLSRSVAVIVGCGALGSVQATTLARAGVGSLRLIDRDFLELNNLQRQVLYDEKDVESGIPKAIAAKNKLAQINSSIEIQSHVSDLNFGNIGRLLDGATVVLDGTDNFETRFLINDYCVRQQIPWVYGGCLGCDGQSMTIVPGDTACLHCLMLEGPPAVGTTQSCDSAGILSPAINVIASIQSLEAMKIMAGKPDLIRRTLLSISLWDNRIREMNIEKLREQVDCPVCKQQSFRWLDGEHGQATSVLCGRNSVQIRLAGGASGFSFDGLKQKVADRLTRQNQFLIQFAADELQLTVFKDGRVIVQGTEDIALAKSMYARWIGN